MNKLSSDRILEICRPRDGMNFYVIGPFAARVSFPAQQSRAINLVYSLQKHKVVARGSRVAVIGAGIAGTTAALALVGVGCKVDIFEKGSSILPRQIETSHRIVNPTITQWPHQELSETTSLRFLDWYQMPCSEIIELFKSEYDKVKAQNKGLISEYFGLPVTKISKVDENEIALEVDHKVRRGRYHAVVLCVGFGEEERGKGIISPREWVGYWTPDNVVDTRNNSPNVRFIISGAGDGGMIDMLRILHSLFNKGELPVRVAAMLEGTALAVQIVDAERLARGRRNYDAELDRAYKEFARQLRSEQIYREVHSLLSKSYVHGMPSHVLIDKVLEYPVSGSASSINKLMIYHALAEAFFTFEHGELNISDDIIALPSGETHRSREVRVIVRHGPVREFGNCLTSGDLKRLEEFQAPVSEEMAVPIWDEKLKAPKPLPSQDPRTPEYKYYRADLARDFINRKLKSYVELEITDDGYDVLTSKSGPLPKEVFGVSLTVRPPIVARPIFTRT